MQRLTLTIIALLFVGLAPVVHAEELIVRPFLLEETITPQDMLTTEITLHSTYEVRKLNVYATVNEITMDEVGEIKEFVSPVMTDRTKTVTSWIEINRGRIDVLPGETVTVPLTIRTHPDAVPGTYHVFLGFVPTNKRDIAERQAMAGKADGVILKLVVADDRAETLRLSRFSIDRVVFGKEEQTANIELQNLGELATTPSGEVIFYNSNGEEIGAADVNTAVTTIEPGERVTLNVPLPIDDTIGRFKANVSLTYGVNQTASLHDSTTFYLLPPHLMLLLFGGVLVVGILIALFIHRMFAGRYEDDDDSVALFVREGHEANPYDHDIDLKSK